MVERKKCVVCEHKCFTHVYNVDMPISLATCAVPVEYQTDTMHFVECSECKTIQLRTLIEPTVLYNKHTNHNSKVVGSTWRTHYDRFVNSFGDVFDKRILEIGSSSDKILEHVKTYRSYTIVDPSIEDHDFSSYPAVTCVKEFFEDYATDEQYDLIVSSHFFEHVYQPLETLRKMKSMLVDGGHIIMSVPNLEEENNTFLGMHFEHTYHANRSNIREMCERSSLRIEAIEFYEKHSVFYRITHEDQGDLDHGRPHSLALTPYTTGDGVSSFKDMFMQQTNAMLHKIDRFNSSYDENNTYFIFGCHFRTQAYLHMGLDPERFEYVLDNDVNKQNKRFYGTPLECKTVHILSTYDGPLYVFVDISAYTDEVKRQLTTLFPHVHII